MRQLAEALWETAADPEPSDAMKAELTRRVARLDAGQTRVRPWADVKAELLAEWERENA